MANRTVIVASSGGDYTTLNAAFAQEMNDHSDLVTEQMILTFDCRNFEDTTAVVTGTGWTTSADYYLNVVAADNHNGKWSTSCYRLTVGDDTSFSIGAAHTRLTGLQISQTNTYRISLLIMDDANGPVYVSKCIIAGPSATSSNGGRGISVEGANSQVINLWNNVIYRFTDGIMRSNSVTSTWNVYNNTICDGQGTGLTCSYINTARLRNNIVQGFGTDYAVTQITSTTTAKNISEDTSSPDESYRELTVAFVDADNYDLHLASGDTAAQNAGDNLSADGSLAFSDDIDGETRVAPWDIGADQILSSAALLLLSQANKKRAFKRIGKL